MGIDIREDERAPPFQNIYALVETGTAPCGEPDVFGYESGADDGGFLCLDKDDGGVGPERKEVFAEQALCHRPVLRQDAFGFETGMDPVDGDLATVVFDPVAGVGVVADDFAAPTTVLAVQLEENGCTVPGNAEAIVGNETVNGGFVKESTEEGDEVRVVGITNGAGHDVSRDETE